MIADMSKALDTMIDLCDRAREEPNGCCTCNFLYPKFTSLFHEAKQMGIVLRKSFKGDHFWVPPIPKQLEDAKAVMSDQEVKRMCSRFNLEDNPNPVKIDAMFFTANETTCTLYDPNAKEAPDSFRDYDTFILCNPNAMSYQHMINYPHAYYLKYFLHKSINVFVWNYRGYGRTRGSTEPHTLGSDAEQVLNFLKLRIGVRGKIGVYGRSLGCVATCHL